MAVIGVGKIFPTVTNGPYFYTWTVDGVIQTCVNQRTKGQAVNEVLALANALQGTVLGATISVQVEP